MKKTLTAILVTVAGCAGIWAQTPGVVWSNVYGGNSHDLPAAICKTNDGGTVAVGYTESNSNDVTNYHGNTDIWAVKTNAAGAIVWTRTIGGSSNEEAKSVMEKSDGDIVIVGFTESTDGDFTVSASLPHRGGKDLVVVRLNNDGTNDWIEKFGGTSDEAGNSVIEDGGGNIIIAGYTNSNDFDVTGNHLYSTSPSSTTNDFWVLRLSNAGSIIFAKCYGGSQDVFTTGGGNDFACTVMNSGTGGYIVSGSSESVDGDITSPKGGKDIWVININTTGGINWQKSFGGSCDEEAFSCASISSGFVVAGYTCSQDGDVTGIHSSADDVWLVKFDGNGTLLSTKCLGGGGVERAYGIASTPADNGLIIAGRASSQTGDCTANNGGWDWWLVKLGPAFNVIWEKNMGGGISEQCNGVVEISTGEYVAAGFAPNSGGDVPVTYGLDDFWIVKLSVNSGLAENTESVLNCYPNPVSEKLTVELKDAQKKELRITDLMGNAVYSQSIENSKTEIDLSQFNSGIYFLQINSTTGQRLIKKIIIE